MIITQRPTVAVDFDGVLHQWDGQWMGHHVIRGEPLPGAIEWLYDTLQIYEVYILTTRGATWRGRRAIYRWLHKHAPELWEDTVKARGLSRIDATDRKRPALMYVDDRGFRFNGQFPSPGCIRGLRPWWKEKTSVG